MIRLEKYFSNSPDLPRLFILVFTFLICWIIEKLISGNKDENKNKHALFNSRFVIIDAPVQFLIGILFSLAIGFDLHHHFGLFFLFGSIHKAILQFLLMFILLDFFEYVYHVIMHRVKLFWMFHLVHHSDKKVDVSSTLREHPGETFFRLSFTLVWVLITGVPLWIFVLRQFIQIASNIIAHANFKLPEKVNRVVSVFFVTPNMHQVHHHYKLPYTDRNYGDVLSIWDRMFGTFSNMPAEKVVFGIDSCFDESENADFKNLVKIPFSEYRKPDLTEEIISDSNSASSA
jgi:sterol desaturase/sphingolipid hydroxylase (fatty acid hydroxylase superfamily)